MIYDIPSARRGDTWDGISTITIATNGVPVNLTGATVKMEFRQTIDSPVALTLSTDNGGVIIANAVNGILNIPPRLVELPYQKYLYDLQITFPTGYVRTFLEGTWEIKPDITE